MPRRPLHVRVVLASCVLLLASACGKDPELVNTQGGLDIFPRGIPFGLSALGETHVKEVTFTNEGRSIIEVKAISSFVDPSGLSTEPAAAAVDFAPFSLQPGDSRVVSIGFTPVSETEVRASLQVTVSTLGNEEIRELPFSGRGELAIANVRTDFLDFGNVPLSTHSSLPVLIDNPSQLPLEVELTFEGSHASEFGAEKKKVTVEAGQHLGLPVSYSPTQVGAADATLQLRLCARCPTRPIALTGVGVASRIEVSPTQLDFGQVALGATSKQVVTIRNLGTQGATFEGAGLVGASAAGVFVLENLPAAPVSVGAGETLELPFEYRPNAVGSVDRGTLEVRTREGSGKVSTTRVLMRGVGRSACIVSEPRTLDFGTVPFGSTAYKNVKLVNRCSTDAQIADIAVSTESGGFFMNASSGASYVVPSNASVEVTVAYMPKQGAEQSRGTLTVTSHEGGAVRVMATPIRGGARVFNACTYRWQPTPLEFGSVRPGRESLLSVYFHNTGTDDCFVSSMALAPGTDPAFTADVIQSALVPPGGKRLYVVRFRPTELRSYSGLIQAVVNHPTAPLALVEVLGEGRNSCLTIEHGVVDFGDASLICPPTRKSFELKNDCDVPVTLTSLQLEQGASPELQLTTPLLFPLDIAARDGVTVEAQYFPVDDGVDVAVLEANTAEGLAKLGSIVGAGHSKLEVAEHFRQQGRPAVDVLFVIDNSGSMQEEQTRLRDNMQAFLDAAEVDEIDYHVAVTTTGLVPSSSSSVSCPGGVKGGEAGRFFPVDGLTPRIITRQTPNGPSSLLSNVQVGLCQTFESGLEAAYRALSAPLITSTDDPRTPEPNDGNAGFLRKDAHLAVYFISDEEDGSPGSLDFYESFFRSLKSDATQLTLGGAFHIPGSQCVSADAAGQRYAEFIRRFKGTEASICDTDWSLSIRELAMHAFGGKAVFPLKKRPMEAASVTVEVNGTPLTEGWKYDGTLNAVTFDRAAIPPFGSTIDVRYTPQC